MMLLYVLLGAYVALLTLNAILGRGTLNLTMMFLSDFSTDGRDCFVVLFCTRPFQLFSKFPPTPC
jgi:hypothetical protein